MYKKIFDKLVEECSENIDENKIIYNGTLNAIPLFIIFLIISINISSVFIYFHWYLKKDNIYVKFNTNIQTTIY